LNKLYKGDCLEVMKNIADKSIDAIITDPPYGTTACKWDSVIPFNLMWKQLNRIIKPNGAIVLFGSEPFSSALRMSNIKNYKYDWIWQKSNPANIALANRMPLKYHEVISVFYKKQPIYNKQMIPRDELGKKRLKNKNNPIRFKGSDIQGTSKSSKNYDINRYDENFKNPSTVLKFKVERGKKHQTQKPIALMEYLIKTYTNELETVLDFTMGSGTTGVACYNTNCNFIGIEQDEKYFKIAEERIKEHQQQTRLF
jgi:DNA modification methylase